MRISALNRRKLYHADIAISRDGNVQMLVNTRTLLNGKDKKKTKTSFDVNNNNLRIYDEKHNIIVIDKKKGYSFTILYNQFVNI